jgi:hypothetical protein
MAYLSKVNNVSVIRFSKVDNKLKAAISKVNGIGFFVGVPPPSGSVWNYIASDGSGDILVAVRYEYVYVSTNRGVSWTSSPQYPTRLLKHIGINSDGSFIGVCSNNASQLIVSENAGVSWSLRGDTRGRTGLTASSTGLKLATIGIPGSYDSYYVLTSTDGGYNWTSRFYHGSLGNGIAADSTGTYIIVTTTRNPGFLYRSGNSGATWSNPFNYNCSCPAVNSDGSRMALKREYNNPGYIYTSSNYGVNWSVQSGSGSRYWNSICMDSTGQYLAASVGGGYIYTSNDWGVTWVQRTNSGSRYWTNVASDSTGQYLVAATSYGSGGGIFISNSYGENWTLIT